MKYIMILLFGCIFFSCQKETGTINTIESLADSLTGEWKYRYDYRLTATQANPDVIIDSCCGHPDIFYTLSYLVLDTDSTFNGYKTEMETTPSIGLSFMGRWILNDSSRQIKMMVEKESSDHYGPNTITFNPPCNIILTIKYLSADSLVTFFKVASTDNNYYYWHDVYTR